MKWTITSEHINVELRYFSSPWSTTTEIDYGVTESVSLRENGNNTVQRWFTLEPLSIVSNVMHVGRTYYKVGPFAGAIT